MSRIWQDQCLHRGWCQRDWASSPCRTPSSPPPCKSSWHSQRYPLSPRSCGEPTASSSPPEDRSQSGRMPQQCCQHRTSHRLRAPWMSLPWSAVSLSRSSQTWEQTQGQFLSRWPRCPSTTPSHPPPSACTSLRPWSSSLCGLRALEDGPARQQRRALHASIKLWQTFNLSRGAVDVLDTAPASPPATRWRHQSPANKRSDKSPEDGGFWICTK